MKFAEAVEVLKQGGRVSRELWHGGTFLMIEPLREEVIAADSPHPAAGCTLTRAPQLVLVDPLGGAHAYQLNASDLTADWCAVTN